MATGTVGKDDGRDIFREGDVRLLGCEERGYRARADEDDRGKSADRDHVGERVWQPKISSNRKDPEPDGGRWQQARYTDGPASVGNAELDHVDRQAGAQTPLYVRRDGAAHRDSRWAPDRHDAGRHLSLHR